MAIGNEKCKIPEIEGNNADWIDCWGCNRFYVLDEPCTSSYYGPGEEGYGECELGFIDANYGTKGCSEYIPEEEGIILEDVSFQTGEIHKIKQHMIRIVEQITGADVRNLRYNWHADGKTFMVHAKIDGHYGFSLNNGYFDKFVDIENVCVDIYKDDDGKRVVYLSAEVATGITRINLNTVH